MAVDFDALRFSALVGNGPFGYIWRVRQVGKRRRTWLAEELGDDDALTAALAARMHRVEAVRHPFIARPAGMGLVEGRRVLLFEDPDGCSVSTLLNGGAVPLAVAVEITRKLARALHAAWDRVPSGAESSFGLVHGDLAPHHVWLGRSGQVKLHGLGVEPSEGARERDAARSRLPHPTPWTSPESQAGVDSHAADVYALGAILAQLVTGSAPSYASSQAEWHEAVVASTAERAGEASGHDELGELGELVATCMAFSAEDRPSAHEVEQALDRLRRDHREPRLSAWAAETVEQLAREVAEETALAVEESTQDLSPGPHAEAPPPAELSSAELSSAELSSAELSKGEPSKGGLDSFAAAFDGPLDEGDSSWSNPAVLERLADDASADPQAQFSVDTWSDDDDDDESGAVAEDEGARARALSGVLGSSEGAAAPESSAGRAAPAEQEGPDADAGTDAESPSPSDLEDEEAPTVAVHAVRADRWPVPAGGERAPAGGELSPGPSVDVGHADELEPPTEPDLELASQHEDDPLSDLAPVVSGAAPSAPVVPEPPAAAAVPAAPPVPAPGADRTPVRPRYTPPTAPLDGDGAPLTAESLAAALDEEPLEGVDFVVRPGARREDEETLPEGRWTVEDLHDDDGLAATPGAGQAGFSMPAPVEPPARPRGRKWSVDDLAWAEPDAGAGPDQESDWSVISEVQSGAVVPRGGPPDVFDAVAYVAPNREQADIDEADLAASRAARGGPLTSRDRPAVEDAAARGSGLSWDDDRTDAAIDSAPPPAKDTGFLDLRGVADQEAGEVQAPVGEPVAAKRRVPLEKPSEDDDGVSGLVWVLAALALLVLGTWWWTSRDPEPVAARAVEAPPTAPASTAPAAASSPPPGGPSAAAGPAPVAPTAAPAPTAAAAPTAAPAPTAAAAPTAAPTSPVTSPTPAPTRPAPSAAPAPSVAAAPAPSVAPAQAAAAPSAPTPAPKPAAQPASAPADPPVASTPSPGAPSEDAAPRLQAASSSGAPRLVSADRPNAPSEPPPAADPPAAEPSPPTPAATSSSFSVKGDAASVALIDEGGRTFAPGPVPEGAYRVMVTFSAGSAPVPVDRVRIRDGQQVQVNCSAAFLRCRVE